MSLPSSSSSSSSSSSHVTASFYNSLQRERGERANSPVFALRILNNFAKSIALRLHLFRERMYVLDLGGGKGGDFRKYNSSNVKHVEHVDIAYQSLVDASKRFQEDRNPPSFSLDLVCADFAETRLVDKLSIPPNAAHFDVSVSMFASHYAFASEEKARCFFQNCTDRLVEGGNVLLTVADGDWILQNLNKFCAEDKLFFGNKLLRISIDSYEEMKSWDAQSDSLFGASYRFFLMDCVEDVPEFLVNEATIRRLAHEFNLEVRLMQDLPSFVKEHRGSFSSLAARMGANRAFDEISPEEKEAMRVYRFVALRKRVPAARSIPPSLRICVCDPSLAPADPPFSNVLESRKRLHSSTAEED